MVALTELMALNDDWIEVIDDKVVKKKLAGGLHHFIAGNIVNALDPFVRDNKLGFVFGDGLLYFICQERDQITGALIPDVSFIRNTSILGVWDIRLPIPGAPTLAVEVVSRDDDPIKLLTRIHMYLESGTAQVWVVYPELKEVHQYRADMPGIIRAFRSDMVIDSEILFPGLKLVTADFFVLPDLPFRKH